MFVATKPLTESTRLGPPIKHAPGDVLERWADWPYRVRVALIHAEMAEEQPDIEVPVTIADALAAGVGSDVDAIATQADQSLACGLCDGRMFINAPALKRHTTRMHS